jgi:hypothetical protein
VKFAAGRGRNRLVRNDIWNNTYTRGGEIRIYLVSRLWLIVKFRASVFRQHNDWWCMERKLEGNHTLQTREADVTFASRSRQIRCYFFPPKCFCAVWVCVSRERLFKFTIYQTSPDSSSVCVRENALSATLLFLIKCTKNAAFRIKRQTSIALQSGNMNIFFLVLIFCWRPTLRSWLRCKHNNFCNQVTYIKQTKY